MGHALQTVEPAGDFIEDAADEGGVKNLKVDFLDGHPYFDYTIGQLKWRSISENIIFVRSKNEAEQTCRKCIFNR